MASQLITKRDLYKQLDTPGLQAQSKQMIFQNVQNFTKISGQEAELMHFLNYQPVTQSQDFMHLQGKAFGDAKSAAEAEAYAS